MARPHGGVLALRASEDRCRAPVVQYLVPEIADDCVSSGSFGGSVFVKTNWVFELCAPAHRRMPEAQALAARAASTHGDLVLHVPAVSLREGANAIPQKCKPSMRVSLDVSTKIGTT